MRTAAFFGRPGGLSLLSSLVMIRLGKVYAGLMVDVQASNAKIAERRENMLIHLTGKSAEEVREAAP